MTNFLTTMRDAVMGFVWGGELRNLPWPRRLAARALRMLYVIARDVAAGDLNLRAMSMVYTTLLSVVPLLAFSFSVLKGFGVYNQLEPLLYRFMEPLGPKGAEVAGHVIDFVANVKVGVLGSVGLALLIYTVLSLLQKIESSFNYVWRIERLRSIGQRFSNYLSVILVGPVLLFSAIGITATVMNNALVQRLMEIEPLGTLVLEFSRLVPYLLVVAAFTFIYMFIPNTRVRLGAALVGGLIAGVLWQSTGWAFAAFIASSTQYAAIYSSFAILVLLLIWLYVNWLVLLLGAQIAFYVQHPQYLVQTRVRLTLSNRLQERLSLMLMYLIADHHHRDRPAWGAEALARHLDLPIAPLQRLIDSLVEQGHLVELNSEPVAYVPARDIATIRIADLVEDVRSADESRFLRQDRLMPLPAVDAVIERANRARAESFGALTLRDLLEEGAVGETL
jgi:membrane protein